MKIVFNGAGMLVGCALVLAGCHDPQKPVTVVHEDPSDTPIAGASADLVARFNEGDAIFDALYREADGLGPLYVRGACSSCHAEAGRGPGNVQKMAVVLDDGVTPGDQSALHWGPTIRAQLAAGATTPIAPPADAHVKVTTRAAPAVLGRGYIDAVDEAEILRVEAEQAARGDAIHGRANRVTYQSQANPDTRYHQYQPGQPGLIGRFGLKSRIATIDDFVADAAQGDMGITSALRPTELPNPDGLTDDRKPGPDLDVAAINAMADYARLIAIPARPPADAEATRLFAEALCSACHVPSLRTRADYPLALLRGIDAPIFSDLLLHDMGADLADGLTDGQSSSRQWRTAPLIGLRFQRQYLHDGRATTVEQAIELHDAPGSEAHDALVRFHALGAAEQQALVDYVKNL
jgi:CxxC motif-containing protein (DUF1111 family)